MDEQPRQPVTDSRKGSRTRWWWMLLVAPLAVGAYLYYPQLKSAAKGAPSGGTISKKKGGKGGDNATTPVIGARAVKGAIGVYFNGLGSVTPISTVAIKSRVDGELMAVNFREGDMVHKGDLLIQIDTRPYQVQLTQAEGQQMKDQATLDNARVDLTRYEGLLKQNAIPEQQVANQRATVKEAEATVKADQGQVDDANLNLTYTRIAAPITGKLGLRLVDAGNIVHASDQNALVVITQMDPISVLFTISEDQLPTVLQKMRAGVKLVVQAYDRDMKRRLASGVLTTVDNEIDQTTGTVRLRATFDNQDNLLFPSQFVNARLLVEEKRGVLLLPTAAIQRSSSKIFVYLVKADSTVTVSNITTGTAEGETTEITSGLKAGDVVVMTGADKLQEGSKVRVEIPGETTNAAAGKQQAGRSGGGKRK